MLRALGRLWPGCVMLVVLLAAATAGGAPADEATRLFREGRQAMHDRDYRTACAKFAASQELVAAAGTLLNLAVCLETVGRLADALARFREVAAMLPPGDARQPFAAEKIDGLEPRVPRLRLRPAADAPPETGVALDGVGVATAALGGELRVDPGKHVVEVRAPGYEDRRFHVELVEGDSTTIELALGPRAGLLDEGGVDTGPPSGPSPLLVGGLLVGGIGLVALVAGIATGALAIEKKNVVDEHCGPEICDSQEGVDAAADGAALSAASTATFVVGIVALGAGVTMVVLAATNDADEHVELRLGPGTAALSGVFR
jgi:hypothetical protein